jgi:hypothetical protein
VPFLQASTRDKLPFSTMSASSSMRRFTFFGFTFFVPGGPNGAFPPPNCSLQSIFTRFSLISYAIKIGTVL